MADCQRGIVFDSLDTLFAQNAHSAVHAVLRALNNRRHIYMVTLRMQYQQLKDKQQLLQEAKGFFLGKNYIYLCINMCISNKH